MQRDAGATTPSTLSETTPDKTQQEPCGGNPADRRDVQMLRRCVEEAVHGPEVNPNPRVGSVILDAHDRMVGVGHHQGAGSAHAEVIALAQAGGRAEGGTAYVSLEPCAHQGRTPPCARALLEAGVVRVVYAVADPDPRAAGGGSWLAERGVHVERVPLPAAEEVVRHWALAARTGRPWVTWKFAATLDGRVAAADGSSAWVTSPQARADVHDLRSRCGAIIVGTGTALSDDPTLSARRSDGSWYADQPLRVVLGRRDLPVQARLLDPIGVDSPLEPALHLRTDDVAEALQTLHARGIRRAVLEGGPTLAAAMWQAGCVDEVIAYLAPALLGSGAAAVGDLGIAHMPDIARLDLADVARVGPDLRITAYPHRPHQED